MDGPQSRPDPPEPTRLGDVPWLEPYPDLLLDQLRYRLVATRANGQPAFGIYVNDPRSGVLHANGLMVLTLAGDRISALTRFDDSNLARFGLPRALDA